MLKNRAFHVLAVSVILCAAYFLWIAPLRPVEIANLKAIDAFFNLRSRLEPRAAASRDAVLVTIDDESLRRMNMQWPWPRSVIAGLIERIASGRPSLICADLVFAGKSADPLQDAALINALRGAGNVFGAAYFGSDGLYVIPDEPIALGLAGFGFVNKPRDIDNTVRRMRPYMLASAGGVIDYSLALKTAAAAGREPAVNIARILPLRADGTAYIDYYGRLNDFNKVAAWELAEGTVEPSVFKDKLVFFGVVSESFHDVYPTPLGVMPGLCIDLNETLTYINKAFFGYAARPLNYAAIFIFTLAAVAGALSLPVLAGIAFAAALIFISFSLGFFLFTRHVMADSFGPILLITVSTVLLHGIRSIMLALENIVLKKEAVTDGLTGLYVYRYFELQLKRALADPGIFKKNLALVIYDIDHFKHINDTYGHDFGNTVLKSIASSLKNHSRKSNIIARYGGEEFCIIITGMDRDHVIKYAERLRDLVGSLEFRTDKQEIVKVTISGGIAMASDVPGRDYSDLVKAADLALYRSKNEGRDRITIFGRPAPA